MSFDLCFPRVIWGGGMLTSENKLPPNKQPSHLKISELGYYQQSKK